MAKRIFISFAIEDEKLRDLIVGQAKNERSPFEFVDMSVKEPWDNAWKSKCRTKIKGCDGMIIIVTSNTKKAEGQIWEVKCSKEENIKRMGIWGRSDDRSVKLPSEMDNIRIVNWSWDNIANFIDSL